MTHMTKFDPFAELQALQKQFFGDDWMAASPRTLPLPATDVYTEDDKNLIIEAHLPNFDDDDIDVHVEDDYLVVRAERHEKEEDKKKKYVVRESSSSFYRRIRLPHLANKDKIEATRKDGVLKVVVPFKSQHKPKQITIKKK